MSSNKWSGIERVNRTISGILGKLAEQVQRADLVKILVCDFHIHLDYVYVFRKKLL